MEDEQSAIPGRSINEPYKAVQPCDHCGIDDEPVHAVPTGDGFLILCADCRSLVAGGS